VLLLATLIWGGCVSCPQYFVTQVDQSDAHGCCHKPAPDRASTAKSCTLQAYDLSAYGLHAVEAPADAGVAAPGLAPPAPTVAVVAVTPSATPPDLLALHRILLI
jgi:hypothetical protein